VPGDRIAAEFLGVFSPHRAGALAGVSGNQIGQWARYGLIRPTVYEGRPANRYAFYDVAEAIVVHWLNTQGFDYAAIHEAIADAQSRYPSWPLIRAEVGIARDAVGRDRGMIVERQDGQYVEIGRPGGQIVLQPELFNRAHDMLRSGGWLADRLGLQRIEVDPEKVGGAPTLRGRRWPVERVARIAADADGRAILTEDYGLDSRDVDESLQWTDAAAAL
jgi:uncharacterized protein (DUF433 family)/DNA-binding transcriptional MerR regulator